MLFDECPVQIIRRCARGAGLIGRDEALSTSLEAFGMMVALECAELAERAADADTPALAGQHIRNAFLGRFCTVVASCPRSVPRPQDGAGEDGGRQTPPDGTDILPIPPKT